jgi:hypothetical protein
VTKEAKMLSRTQPWIIRDITPDGSSVLQSFSLSHHSLVDRFDRNRILDLFQQSFAIPRTKHDNHFSTFLYLQLTTKMASTCTVLSDNAPVEIILEVFKSCDSFEEIHSLTRMSKRLNAIWHTHAPIIIWEVAPRIIPVFDRALMAVSFIALCF